MKIFQIVGNKAHWLTPYKSMNELYTDVPQGKGKTEKQRRYPATDIFAEASDKVQEGWIYLGDGKFRTDEPERMQEEIGEIDKRLRDMYKESLFHDWLQGQIAKCGANQLTAFAAAVDFAEADNNGEVNPEINPSSVYELVKTKNELVQKLKDFEPEVVSL